METTPATPYLPWAIVQFAQVMANAQAAVQHIVLHCGNYSVWRYVGRETVIVGSVQPDLGIFPYGAPNSFSPEDFHPSMYDDDGHINVADEYADGGN